MTPAIGRRDEPTQSAAPRTVPGTLAFLMALGLVSSVAERRTGEALPLTAPPLKPEAARLLIDPNTAAAEELMLLPGIGPKLSDAIIQYRDSTVAKPAFRCPEDLDFVPRIGPATVARLRDWLQFPEPSALARAPTAP